MVDDQGCSPDEPGIGNIAYVKDIQTEAIVSTGYRCSVFGKYQHPLTGFGWVSVNQLYILKLTAVRNKQTKSLKASFIHGEVSDIYLQIHDSINFQNSFLLSTFLKFWISRGN